MHAGKGDEERDLVNREKLRQGLERVFGKRDLPRAGKRTVIKYKGTK